MAQLSNLSVLSLHKDFHCDGSGMFMKNMLFMFKRGTKGFEQEVLQAIHGCFAVFTEFFDKLVLC